MSEMGDLADILLVEDNPGDVRLTREALTDGKVHNTLHVVNDGVEALDFCYQRGEYEASPRPDIILLDLNLPRKDGDEVLETIKDDPNLKRIPVIVLTSSDTHQDIVESYDLNANAYLTKPVDPAEFIDTIRTLERFWLTIVRLPNGDP